MSSTMRSTLVLLTIIVSARPTAIVVAQEPRFKVGDRVVVVPESVELRVGAEVVAKLPKGQQLNVTTVRGQWIGCSLEIDGQKKGGWVPASLLAIAPPDSGAMNPKPVPPLSKFDWAEESFFAGPAPRTVGVAVIVHRTRVRPDGSLDPMFSADAARKTLADWLAYKPELAMDDLAVNVRDEVLKSCATSLEKAGFAAHPKAMDQPQTVQSFLAEIPRSDAILVLCLADPQATLVNMIQGDQLAAARAETNVVLLNGDLKAVAGHSTLYLSKLPTVGALEKDYQNATPFRANVKFRFTTKAFLEALVPQVLDEVESIFVQSLRAM